MIRIGGSRRGLALLVTAAWLASAVAARSGPSCVVPAYGDDPQVRARLAGALGSSPRPPSPRVVSTVGSVRLLVILAEFADVPHRIEPSRFDALLFGASSPSVAHYYDAVSGGRFSLEGDLFGWVGLPQTQFYYSQNVGGVGTYPNNGRRMAEDAVLAAIASAGLDLGPYDADADGVVDALLVIHSGQGLEWAGITGPNAFSTDPDPGAINSHKWVVRNSVLQPGAPLVVDYFTGPELQLVRPTVSSAWTDSIATIGVYAHEFGHALGLPDFYDTQTGENYVGVWGLMDYGVWNALDPDSSPVTGAPGALPCHFSAWSKMFLGWVEPQAVAPGVGEAVVATVDLLSASRGGSPLQTLPNPFGVDWSIGSPGTGEYFLAEVRTREGYDAGLPTDGVLVYHVDETRASNSSFDNAGEARLLRLEPRDGRIDVNANNPGLSATEAWPGAGESDFDAASDPSSGLYDGSPSGVSLADITTVNGAFSATVDAAVENLRSTVPTPFARPNPWWPAVHGELKFVVTLESPGVGSGHLLIYDASGRTVRTLPATEFQSSQRIAVWDGATDDGTRAAAGVYFFRLDTTASTAGTGRFMLLR